MSGSLLRPAEAHVRVLSHYEAFAVSSNHANVKLSRLGAPDTTDVLPVSRVHRGVTTADMFADVVLPCVSNAFSGQSFTILVCGPRDSGRSVTLYGNPKLKEKGLIELTADELLRAGEAHEATMSHSHFMVEGEDVVDCLDVDHKVPIVEFPAPIGTVALPLMDPLTRASDAVVIVPARSTSSSLFTQFHVYTAANKLQQGGTTRRTLSVVTFVDVCAFTRASMMPPDLSALCSAVRCVSRGEDARTSLQCCRLTQLLENALMGSSTLMCVATITGNPDLFHDTKEALQFSSAVHGIQQVLMLLHMQNPKWVFDSAAHCEELRMRRGVLMANSYATGVMEYFQIAQRIVEQSLKPPEDMFDGILAESAQARKLIAEEIARQAAALRALLAERQLAVDVSAKERSAMEHQHQRTVAEISTLDAKTSHLEEHIGHIQRDAQDRVNAMRTEVYAIKTQDGVCRSELVQYERLEDDAVHSVEDGALMSNRFAREFSLDQKEHGLSTQIIERAAKKRRLEAALNAASQVAQSITTTHRQHRERATLMSRLSLMEHGVCSLRSRSVSESSVARSAEDFRHPSMDGSGASYHRDRQHHHSNSSGNGSNVPLTARHYVDPTSTTSAPSLLGQRAAARGAGVPAEVQATKRRGRQPTPSTTPTPTRRRARGDPADDATIASLYM